MQTGHEANEASRGTPANGEVRPCAGLVGLDRQRLSPRNRRLLGAACANAAGSPFWVSRKSAEARDLLALSERAPHRLKVHQLSIGDDLKALCELRVPVATRTSNDGDIEVAGGAVLGLCYPRAALLEAQPGYAFITILSPQPVWHAQVSAPPLQHLCLGDTLPAGVRVKELILMAYAALSMQTFQINAADAAGVLNAEAARWWQSNPARIPLSRAPFLAASEHEQ